MEFSFCYKVSADCEYFKLKHMDHFFKYEKDKRYYQILLSFLIPVFVLFVLFGYFFNERGKKLHLSYSFDGKVDSVTYDIKKKANVRINGISYELDDPSWEFKYNPIEKGDSMTKSKNSMIIKLFKKDGRILVVGREFK